MISQETNNDKSPNGGSYSTIYYKDNHDNPADKTVATKAVIVEYDVVGNPIARTYVNLKESASEILELE